MKNLIKNVERWFAQKVFCQADRLNDFYDELLETIQMNINIRQFLESRLETAIRRKNNDLSVYKIVLERVKAGEALSDAGRGFFPPSNRIMIQAGEHVNQVAEGVKTALFANQSAQKMQSIIWKSMIMPAAIVLADLGLMLLFGGFVVPQFLLVMPVDRLPAALRFSFNFSTFIMNYMFVAVPLLLGIIGWVIWSLPNYSGPARRYLDGIPPYSLYRFMVSSSTLITFSGLLRNNVTMEDAIGLMLENASGYERSHLWLIRKRMSQGHPLTIALDSGLVPRRIVDRLRAFEAAGSNHLEAAMRKMGFENVERSLKIVEVGVKAASNLIYGAAGGVLAWLAFGLLTIAPQLMASVQSMQSGIQ